MIVRIYYEYNDEFRCCVLKMVISNMLEDDEMIINFSTLEDEKKDILITYSLL